MPWMNMDTRPDPNRIPCGNCGEPWEEHKEVIEDDRSYRVCADGLHEFRAETDEDRRAARATAMGL